MATVSGTIVAVHGHTTSTGPARTSAGKRIFNCHVVAEFSGTYAQSDNAQISDVDDAIASALHTGSTVALVDAAFAQAGIEGTNTVIGAKTVAVSGSNITCELTGGDLSTEHSSSALGTPARGIDFFVSYTVDP
jgi:ribonuclease PH